MTQGVPQGVPLALPHHLGDPSPESLAFTQHPGRMSRIDRNDNGDHDNDNDDDDDDAAGGGGG